LNISGSGKGAQGAYDYLIKLLLIGDSGMQSVRIYCNPTWHTLAQQANESSLGEATRFKKKKKRKKEKDKTPAEHLLKSLSGCLD